MPKTTKGSRRHKKSKSKTKSRQKYSRRQKKQSGSGEHMDTIPNNRRKRQELEKKKLEEKLRYQQQSLQAPVPVSSLQEQIKNRLFGNSGK